ncbi:Ribonuclease H-like superfamily [Sesbania bispinosa]|nr:Ribonuclease H-like superfamily [Sesbania bispinosa]
MWTSLWCLERLYTWATPATRELFGSIVPRVNLAAPDRWVWETAGSGVYTAASGMVYQQMIKGFIVISLLLRAVRVVRDPLFFQCSDVCSWLHINLAGPHGTVFLAGLWWVWRWRNNLWRSDPEGFRCIVWHPPPAGVIKINVDGSFFLDSDRMGIGVVFRGADCKWILGISGFIGPGDNLLAEVHVVFWGLKWAWLKGFRNVIFESDSFEVIQHLTLVYPLHLISHSETLSSIWDLLHRSWEVSLCVSPWEANKPVDWLAKEGARSSDPPLLLDSPPPEVASLLLVDELGV